MSGTPPVGLRAIGAAMDLYKMAFVANRAAPLLSRSRPVRRTGFDRDVVVAAVGPEADEVMGVRLVAPDGGELPAWKPGSHLDVFLPSGLQRQYSLCGDPGDRFSYRIAVRHIRDGGGGSQEIHERLRVGDWIRIRGPRNAFTFVDAPSYLFIAGGIGITPILPMVAAAGSRGRLIYTGRNRASMPFLDRLRATADIRPDDEFGTPDIAAAIASAEPGAAVYVCGPPPMLDAAVRSMFAGNPTGSLHTERFSATPVVDGNEFAVTLARSGRTVQVGADETALTAIRRTLPGVVYSCQQGFCGSCKVAVREGAVDHRDHILPPEQRDSHMLTCVSRAAGDSLELEL